MTRGSHRIRKTQPQQRSAKSLAKVQGFAMDMEEPLNEIENLAQALRFIGYGLESHNDDIGSPISTLAWTAVKRLSALREIWRKMVKATAGA
jgi:hypothetical protein